MSDRKMPQSVKMATELGPLFIFFGAYYLYDLYMATGAIMITTAIALAVTYGYERRIPAMPLITAVVIAVFGGLTLYLQDDTFIKMKPTIIYALFAAALGAGLVMGKSFIKILFGNFWDLHEAGWRTLTIRVSIFFLFLAVMNEVVWRNFSTDLWVNVKVFGFTGITMVFFMAQVPLLTRHSIKDDTTSED